MKILASFFVTFLLVFPSHSQSKMTDRDMDGLLGKVKTVKLEWKEITGSPRRKPRKELFFISQDLFTEEGQLSETLYQNDYKTLYKFIDGFKTFTSVTPKSSTTDGVMTARVDGDQEVPIEKTERITEPDLRYDYRITYDYDNKGRVKAEREFGNNGKLWYLKTFKYDANGKVIEETRNDTVAITKYTYAYDKKGLLIESVEDRDIKGKGTDSITKRVYSDYMIDSQGNWTKRKAHVFYSNEGIREYNIAPEKYDYLNEEYRTITYY